MGGPGDASLVEAAEVKSSLEAVSCQMQDQAKACSPSDQPVRKFKDGLGINDYENFLYFPDRVIFWYPYSSTSMEWGLRRVVPAAAVTTHAKPHAQQQLARARCHGAALSASKFRRGAARQSAATSMARFLVNCSSAAVELEKGRVRACD